tara:strand:+ start:54 stop:665 length:612 start_codon:yes stop_codon:yes gene_type:complete
MKYKTEQEKFWATKFGNGYIKRNNKGNRIWTIGKDLINNNVSIQSALELGCNIGLNLDALKLIYGRIDLYGVEINKRAYGICRKKHKCFNSSIIGFKKNKKYDFVFTSNVLIHQNPEDLKSIYFKMHKLSKKYIYICEYFNPTPMMVSYRGNKDKLFKRDFAKELLNLFPKLELVNYGFHWREDPLLKKSYDSSNWTLFKKKL